MRRQAPAAVASPILKGQVESLTHSLDIRASNNELLDVLPGEYGCIWNMRPAVLINNFLAAERLHGKTFPKGVPVSLAECLGLFDSTYTGFNFNEETAEFVGDLHLSFSRNPVSVIER